MEYILLRYTNCSRENIATDIAITLCILYYSVSFSYEMMLECWLQIPLLRSSFDLVQLRLNKMISLSTDVDPDCASNPAYWKTLRKNICENKITKYRYKSKSDDVQPVGVLYT